MDLSNLEIEINPEYTMMKKVNKNIYLSQEQMDILDSYNVDYKNCSSLSEIINLLEDIYEDTDDDIISNLLDMLEERNYYQNYKK